MPPFGQDLIFYKFKVPGKAEVAARVYREEPVEAAPPEPRHGQR